MTITRMEHVGVVVDDLPAAVEFFTELGMVLQGEASVSGEWVDRIIGLDDARSDIAMLETPDGGGRVELTQFHAPTYEGDVATAPSNRPGLRHLAFQVAGLDDVVARLQAQGGELVGSIEEHEDVYRLCYLRGPADIIIELAERQS